MNVDLILCVCALACFIGAALTLPAKLGRDINLFYAGVAFAYAAWVF